MDGSRVYNSSVVGKVRELEELVQSLVARIVKLEGAMSQTQEHLDKVFTLETDVDMLGDILYDLQHKSK